MDRAIALGCTLLVEVPSEKKLMKKNVVGDGIGFFKLFSFPVIPPSP